MKMHYFWLLLFILLLGCSTALHNSCSDCKVEKISDLFGTLILTNPDIEEFERLPKQKGLLNVDCEYKILSTQDSSDPFELNPADSFEAQNECKKNIGNLLGKMGFTLDDGKSAYAERWVFKIEEKRKEFKRSLRKNLLLPPEETGIWSTLTRFKAKQTEPYTHKYVSGHSEYRKNIFNFGANKAQSFPAYRDENILYIRLVKALLIQSLVSLDSEDFTEDWQEEGCGIVKEDAQLHPEKLMAELLQRELAGEFLQTSPWLNRAVLCPGYMGGADTYKIASHSAIKDLGNHSFSVAYTIEGQVSSIQKGEIFYSAFSPKREQLVETYRFVQTPWGWKLLMAWGESKVSVQTALKHAKEIGQPFHKDANLLKK